jgi:CHAD domain-containing protein/CYTH domain-containing protein
MAELEREDLLRPAEAGARLVALDLLEQARQALGRVVADDEDAEAIHDLRVALRRLRSTLRSYRAHLDADITERALERAGELAARVGAARDLEVQLAWLRAKREGAQRALRETLDERCEACELALASARERATEHLEERFARFERDLRAGLETYRAQVTPSGDGIRKSFAAAAAEALRAATAELCDALARVRGPDAIEIEHEARIAAKRLRYLLEPVRAHAADGPELLRELRRVQDLIGERHDREVLARHLLGALEQAALASAHALFAAIEERDEPLERRLRARPRENAILKLLRGAREEADALFAELAATWLGDKSAPFFARLDRFVSELAHLDASHREIEHKYLLTGLPERVRGAEAFEIEQGYLPGATVRERLRRAVGPRGARHTRTVKLGTGLVRAEFEEELSESEFARLWPLTEGARLEKRRYRVPDGELTWEIDEFLDRELWLAELELPDANTPFDIPEWLAPYVEREVTDDPRYSNLEIALTRAGTPADPG